jgi:3-hydroxybutyryl-CoA dehydrogenase
MSALKLRGAPVLVVGAGIMGAGIAQVAAQAGHRVKLYDARNGASQDAKARLAATFDGLVVRGKLGADAAQATLARIEPLASLQDAADAGLVIEAIVEQLDAKRGLFAQLEGIVGEYCVAPGPAGRHALLQPGCTDEAGGGGFGAAHRARRGRRRL